MGSAPLKILLVKPPYERLLGMRSGFPHLGLASLAAMLRVHGLEVRLYDAEFGPVEEFPSQATSTLWVYRNYHRLKEALERDAHPVWEEWKTLLREFAPDVVGVNVTTPTVPSALKMSELCKAQSPSTIIVWGGPHATIEPVEVLGNRHVDFVVFGEAEETIVEFCQVLARDPSHFEEVRGIAFRNGGKVRINHPRPLVTDLDSLPFPARDLNVYPERYTPADMCTIVGARGCPYRCTYCAVDNVWGTEVRVRSNKNIIAEIRSLLDMYGSDQPIRFVDDTFGLDRKRVRQFCRDLMAAGLDITWGCQTRVNLIDDETIRLMRSAGCREVWLGLESGSDRILRAIGKKNTVAQALRAANILRNNGMPWGANFMLGLPQETLEDIRKTKELIQATDPWWTSVMIFTPLAGTALLDKCKEQDLISGDLDWKDLGFFSPHNYFTPLIPRDEFQQITEEILELADRRNAKNGTRFGTLLKLRHYYFRHPWEFLEKATRFSLRRIRAVPRRLRLR